MGLLYILDADRRPIAVSDMTEWGEWMHAHDHERSLAEDWIGDVRVSTIFLGIACWPTELRPDTPILWETMIFGGTYDRDQFRYASHDEAIAGHAVAVALVRGGAPNEP
jgi:hypothetical protein